MLTFVKLGGSLITDKRREAAFRPDTAQRVAQEIAAALDAAPDLRLLIGHGSGSFGHVVARRYGTRDGVQSPEQWRGFAEVAAAAAELNTLLGAALREAGVPVWRVQPSASARAHDGVIQHMAVHPLEQTLAGGLVPLIYGDVALDDVRGGTILSTESLFFYLAQHLPVRRILLLGEVPGVYDHNRVVFPIITPATIADVERALGGSDGTDVTGGMETKVRDMLALVQRVPTLTIRIMDGTVPGLLRDTLLERAHPGTLLSASAQ